MAFYRTQFTGTEIDQRLAQGTYDDAVKAGFEGTKEEFDALLGQLKQISDNANGSTPSESEDLHTVNKDIVGAINEIYDVLESKPDEQDVIDQGELQVFKDEIAAKYATKGEMEGDIKDINSKISTLNTNLVESVNTINKNVNDSLTIVNEAIQQNAETLVAEINQRKEADKDLSNEFKEGDSNLQKNIETLNQNLVQSINQINENVANGFNIINGAINDEIRPNIENNKTNITQLQETVATVNTNLYKSIETINNAFNNAINTINGGIATEITNRQNTDIELNSKIIQEVSDRQTSDNQLSERIETLENAGYQNAEQVKAEIEKVIDFAPDTLDTLKEISEALNNDPNFATTITEEVSKKLDSDKLISGAGIDISEEDNKKIINISNDALTKIQYADSEVRRLENDKISYAYDEKTQSNINVILPEGGAYLGNYGDDNATIAKAAVYDGIKQLEIGSSKVHTNINTDSDVTIETSSGKKVIATTDQIPDVFELKGLTELETGESSTNIEAALGIDFASLIEIIRENKTIIVDRNSIGDYKACIHATGNISSGNGAANLMFFVGTTPTIYQVQYVSGTFALAVDEYKFAKESDIELMPIEVNFPVRTSGGSDGPEDRVYTQDEILKWFGVADVATLKKQIANKGIQYVKYGIMLMGNPYYYRMPVQYAAFESANQMKLVFTGLNTNNDVVSKYEIIANLDGTIIEGNSNVKMTITSIESGDIDLSEYVLKSELPDTSSFATKSELNTKQDTLVSGTNIRTLNGASLLGEGNIQLNEGTTNYTDLTNKPSINNVTLSGNLSFEDLGLDVNTTWDQIQNKPDFATVATSGDYNDLTNTPNLTVYQTISDDSLTTSAKTIPAAINEVKSSVDQIQAPYEINLTNLLAVEDSESISTAIGGIDNLNATVQDNRIIVGTISNGSVSVSIRILGNVTTLYYLLDSVVGLTLNEIAITNTSGTLSKSVTTHSVLTENMVINSLESAEATLPLSAAQGKVLNSDKQNKTDETLQTTDKTVVGAINELLAKVQELETKNTELESRLATLEGTN